jgi:predicted MFS family arabinose efflux permease
MAMANTMTIAWAVGPVLSPALGGYLQDFFGWKASFYFLAGYSGTFLIAALLAWPETGPGRVKARPGELMRAYQRILFCSEFILSVSLLALLYGFMIVFNVLGPFLLQRGLGFTPVEFGNVVLWLGLAWFLGNVGNKVLSRRFSRPSIVWYGLLVNLGLVLVMIIAAFTRPLEFWSVILPTFGLFLIGGTVFPNVWGRALSIFPDSAGTASALMGSVLILGVSLASAGAGFLAADSARPLSLFYLGLILMSLGVARKLR